MKIFYQTWLDSNLFTFVVTAICYLYYFLIGRYKKKKDDRDYIRGALYVFFALMIVMQISTFPYVLDMFDANPMQKTGVLTYKESSGRTSYKNSDTVRLHKFIIEGEEYWLYVNTRYVDDFDLQVGETYNVTYGKHSEVIIDVEHIEEIGTIE